MTTATAQQRAKAFSSAITLVGAGLMMVGATLTALTLTSPRWESWTGPVLADMRFEEVPAQTEGEVWLRVTGEKLRPCTFVELRLLVKVGDRFEKGRLRFVTDGTHAPTSRPTGAQSFGIWAISPDSDEVWFEAAHQCHSRWQTVTAFGPWKRNVR